MPNQNSLISLVEFVVPIYVSWGDYTTITRLRMIDEYPVLYDLLGTAYEIDLVEDYEIYDVCKNNNFDLFDVKIFEFGIINGVYPSEGKFDFAFNAFSLNAFSDGWELNMSAVFKPIKSKQASFKDRFRWYYTDFQGDPNEFEEQMMHLKLFV